MEKKQYTKLEHYVPQCYLKNFSILENDNYFTYCLFQNSTIIKRININNVCAVNDLYELESFGGYVDRNDIEDGFIDMESKYADFCREHLSQIDHCRTIVLSSTNLELIKDFCAFLVFRSKYMIDLLIKCCEIYVKHNPADWSNIQNEIKSVDPETLERDIIPYLDQCFSYELAYRLMKNMLNTKELSIEVLAMKKSLGSNYCFLYSENNDFITSDTPLVNIYGKNAKCLGFNDIMCLPLTDNCCIVFCDNLEYNGQVIALTTDQVDIVNKAQISKKSQILIAKKEELILK